MNRINNREGFEFVDYEGYCSVLRKSIQLSGIRTWRLALGRNIFSIHEVQCPYAHKCNSSAGCKLITEARCEWASEAQAEREDALIEMLSWR